MVRALTYSLNHTLAYTLTYTLTCTHIYFIIIIEHLKLCQPKEYGIKYSMGLGMIRYLRASKTFSKFRMLRSSVTSKFRAFRSSVYFEVPGASKFRAFRSSVSFEFPCASKFRAVTVIYYLLKIAFA